MNIDGNEIRLYREENLITIEDMAEMLGIEDPELLDRYENGEPWVVEDALTVATLDALFDDLSFVDISSDIEDEELF